jgi:Flp pilus assembly CpaE family ATPase
VDPDRGAKTIAGEARRRVLDAGYLDELPAKVAEWQQEQAEADTRAGIMARAAGLFGLEAPGDAPLNLSRFLPNKRGQAEVSSGANPQMSIELYGLDPDVGMAMLQALSASFMVSGSCCHRYGPGHHPQFEVTGCLRESSERGEQASAERVYTFLTCSRGLDKARVSLALREARTSRYQVAEVMRGDDVVAVVSWNTGGLGEYTVEIPRKDATS